MSNAANDDEEYLSASVLLGGKKEVTDQTVIHTCDVRTARMHRNLSHDFDVDDVFPHSFRHCNWCLRMISDKMTISQSVYVVVVKNIY